MTSSRVVVGTDGSECSDDALRFAAKEAVLRNGDLVVVLSYRGPIDPDLDDFETPKSVQVRRHEVIAVAALCRALDVTPAVLPAHWVVCDDLELSALLVRTSAGADLIVLAQRHEHLLDRLFHSPSCAGRLARRTHVPVVVVPEPSRGNGRMGMDRTSSTAR